MTSSKHTRRALLASILSMLLCAAMLVGSTFAWFTDSVTSGSNQIIAGNLDVELYHSNGNVSNEQVAENTKLFVNADGTDILWEPGVMVYENFTVKNVGSLALKYKLTVNAGDFNIVEGTDQSLKDVLKVAILDEAFTGDRTAAQALTFDKTLADFEKNGNIAAKAADDTYAIVIYWEPSAADNDYNLNNDKESSDGDPLFIELGVNLVATQDTVENDGFGNDYDADAKFPSVIQIPADKTLDGTTGEITNLSGNTVVTASNNTLTFGNNSDIGEATAVDMNGTSQAVKNSIKAEGGQSLTMINGELVKSTTFGKVRFDTNGKEQTGLFENMTFTDTSAPTHTGSSSNDTEQMIQICPNGGGAGTYIFRNCTFNDAYVLVSGINGGAAVDIIFENCTFNNTGNADAIELNPAYVNSGSVTIKDCTFNLVTTSNIYAVDMSGTSKINLTFEGENRVNGTVADDSKYNLFPTTSVTAYNCKNVTGAENVTVSGIATKP